MTTILCEDSMDFERADPTTMFLPVPPVPASSNAYKKNSIFTLHEHPPPFQSATLAEYRENLLDAKGMALERKLHGRLSNCGNHFVSPLPGSPTRRIQLVEPLAVGPRKDAAFPEVWKVQSGDQMYVARIYDPLYVEDRDGFYDIFLFCARSLVNEHRAYDLLKDVQGNLVPRYIGCFLTIIDTLPEDYPLIRWMTRRPQPPSVPIPERRSVFVTLLEHIPGEDLRHSSEWSICAPHRAAVRRSGCIADRELARRQIWHYDLAERNTILKALPPSQEPLCDDVSCKLRWQTPTTLLRELHPTIPSPIAIIDFEDVDFGEKWHSPPNADGDYDLLEDGPGWFSEYWFQ